MQTTPLRRRVRRGAQIALLAATLQGAVRPLAADTPAAQTLTPPKGPFKPDWESVRKSYKTPHWFGDAKFGIFINWGLYAVPAHHNEWYARHMYSNVEIARWHAEHYGSPDKFGYKDFIPLFKAEKYDPGQWAALFKKAGAKYVVPVAEHHDGFAMYDSNLTRWCAGKMGPKRDLIGDLAKAVRKQGLVFGLSSHRMEHHTFMYPQLKTPNDQFDPHYADFYGPPVPGEMNDGNASPAFQADWLARCEELVDKYQPQMFWFDNGVNAREYDAVKLQFAAYYYNRATQWGREASISAKGSAYLAGSILDFEKAGRGPKDILPGAWQIDDQIGSSWGYITDMRYRSAASIVGELTDTVSKGGNLLLNISPMADGTIPDAQQQILLDVGKWLACNGEAIYGSHAWERFSEGKLRFTAKGEDVYVIVPNAASEQTVITSLAAGKADAAKQIKSVSLLGRAGLLQFSQDAAGLMVKLPAEKPSEYACVLKISGLKPQRSQ